MFGVLKPTLTHVSPENRQLYTKSYCNLCAALSISGVGLFNRLFLVNDIVTLDWLLTDEEHPQQHPFSCKNCLKGGVIGKKKRVNQRQTLLAALSTYVCGIKIKDNALDSPNLKNKSLALIYHPLLKKAERLLRQANMLEELQTWLTLDRQNETQHISALEEACKPTEQCYKIMLLKFAKDYATLPQATLSLLGQYLGRCTYLLDAIKDIDEDREKNQYNILNQLSCNQDDSNVKASVVATCLEFLKPMRVDIADKLSSLPDSFQFNTLREKWGSLLFSIEDQLSVLISPLNDERLTGILSSFSNLSGYMSCNQMNMKIEGSGSPLCGGGGSSAGACRGKGDKAAKCECPCRELCMS